MSIKTQSGGMFNSYKINYCPETHKLLKVLMDEVKLTTAQRHQMKECLKKGEPLPVVPRKGHRPSYVDENLFGLKRNFYFTRRGRDQIVHSGAYERERYKFLGRTVDLEKEKEKLQNIMEYGRDSKKAKPREEKSKKKVSPPPKMITPEERIEELIVEIKERVDFLREMEALGKGKNYEAIMRQEIAGKLRELEKLDKNLAQKYSNLMELSNKSKAKAGPLN